MLTVSRGPQREMTKFVRIPTQFIAALGAPASSSGVGATSWGIWREDPGPRGLHISDWPMLKAMGGLAPAGWKFDAGDWWLEEHGLMMEPPEFPLPPGRYLVTGGRETQAVLTVQENGSDWALSDGAKLQDVTHLPCRSARYTPGQDCGTPDNARQEDFPVRPGGEMPAVLGCTKQDYWVVFVVAVEDK